MSDRSPAPLAPEHLRAWRAFLEAHARVVDLLAEELAEREGLPLTWYDVLVHLHEADGDRLRMQELAERILLSKSGLTRLIDRMEREGLVRRAPVEDDGRGTWAELTDAGLARLRATAPTHVSGVVEHFADLIDEDEVTVVADVLARIAATAQRP